MTETNDLSPPVLQLVSEEDDTEHEAEEKTKMNDADGTDNDEKQEQKEEEKREDEHHSASQQATGNEEGRETDSFLKNEKEVIHRLLSGVKLESNSKNSRPTTSSTTTSSSSLSDGAMAEDVVDEDKQVINDRDEELVNAAATAATATTTTSLTTTTSSSSSTKTTTPKKHGNVFERLFRTSNEATRFREKLNKERIANFKLRKEQMSRVHVTTKKIPLSEAGQFYEKNIEWLVQREMRLMNEAITKGDSKFESIIIPQSRVTIKKD
eukprot:CAMPEP_0176499456 /NCGR_PEP_ID=MMETSP0200_2-20121128/12937_1 /TAXON_ID=947934 /ORGANISM="Chaetoceros sp., Strain GSL56" /LENGTH=266 /DNA_ID=CAMNT_0017897877 /DNA_START=48 /DNA_END=848 /DNA_ORIENTATION=+